MVFGGGLVVFGGCKWFAVVFCGDLVIFGGVFGVEEWFAVVFCGGLMIFGGFAVDLVVAWWYLVLRIGLR